MEQKSLVFKNTFTNDGNFLEQFKKMKESKAESLVITKPEIKVEANVPSVSSKGNPDDWYKSALERAKSIAKSMTRDMAQQHQQPPEPNPNQGTKIFVNKQYFLFLVFNYYSGPENLKKSRPKNS